MLAEPVDAVPISNLDSYNELMSKSLLDKAFFLDKINISRVVDFGCADGALGSFIQKVAPEVLYCGYDNDELMAGRANARLIGARDLSRHFATVEWDQVTDWLEATRRVGPSAVVVNSVIHEVYDYQRLVDVAEFWDRVLGTGFDYVVVREMALPRWHELLSGDRWTDLDEFTRSDVDVEREVRLRADPRALAQFEERWGAVSREVNLIHFLMKYRYQDNWIRELNENYFPLNVEELRDTLLAYGAYDIDHFEHYCLKYNRDRILQDFGVKFETKTHAKFILKKRG